MQIPLKAANELEHILNYLEAHKIDMQQVAASIDRSYDYLRGEKVKEKPSQKVIGLIKIKYADQLKDMPPYKASSYQEGEENHEEYIAKEPGVKYWKDQDYVDKWMEEREARLREAEQRADKAEH